jgi:iron complex transport system substrate-binding protein
MRKTNMKKLMALIIALLIALSIFAGIVPAALAAEAKGTEKAAEKPAKEAENEDVALDDENSVVLERAQFPLTVTDQAGNSVTLEQPAERIVSGYYISSSACLALGLKDKLVAVEEKIEARPIYKLSAPELIGTVGNVGSAKAFDLEACLAADPDLVILPKRAQDYAASLAEVGVPAIVVFPESHEALTEMIKLIAAVTGSEDKAEKLLSSYVLAKNSVEDMTADIKDEDKQVVYMCSPGSYMNTAPKDMYQASLIRSAGGINAGDSLDGDSWTEVSYEQILAMNPDVIIIPTNNMANGQPDYSADDVKADKNLSEVNAIKNNQVYNMPAGFEAWDSPVPSGILGMLWLVSTLHPDLYSPEDFALDAAYFYQEFYGFDMDEAALQPAA